MVEKSEFLLKNETRQVLVLKPSVEPLGPAFVAALQRLAERSDVQVIESASVEEIFQISARSKNCLVVAHCSSEQQSGDLNHLLDLCKKEIQSRTTRVLITVSEDFLFLQPKFVRRGAAEVLQHPVSRDVFYAKFERLIDREKIIWKAPLSLRSDCWMLIEGKTRWIPGAKKWLLTVIGPPPSYGEWIPCDFTSGMLWEWLPNGLTDDPFILEEGVWTFHGKKPEFKDGAWLFSGHLPKLSFTRNDENPHVKFEGESDFLNVAMESLQSKISADLIEKSLRSSCRLPREIAPPVFRGSAPVFPGDEPVGGASKLPAPDYLKRVPSQEGKSPCPDSNSLAIHPLAAAFYVSELMRRRDLVPTQMLWKFCEHLKQVSNGGIIELWIANGNQWACIQHDDLIDMALHQRLVNAGVRDSLVRFGGQRALLITDGIKQLGVLVVEAGAADVFTDYELLTFCQFLKGIFLKSAELASQDKDSA